MNKHLNKVFPSTVKLSVLTLGIFLGGHLAAQTDGLRAAEPDECARHAGVLANLYNDLAPWIDRETRVSASK